MGGGLAHAQQTEDLPAMDQAIEKTLDDLLSSAGSESEMLAAMEQLQAKMKPDAPAMTRVRLQSYMALSHAYLGREDYAYQLLDETQQLAQQSGLADALAEVAATRILFKTIEGKLTEAYTLINDAQMPLEQARLPRVRYFAHNLIANVYQAKNLPERALEHLIAAATAVDETADERTPIRRIFLKLRVADIYQKQTQYAAALSEIEEAEQLMHSAGLTAMYAPEIAFQRAVIATSQGNYDRAFEIYTQLERDIQNDPQWASLEPTVLNNLGDLAIRTERYETGIAVLQDALQIARQQGDVITEQMIRFNLGFIDVHLGKFEQGLATMSEIVSGARGEWISSSFEPMLGEYAQALEMAGRHRESNGILLEQRDLREQIFDTELQKNVTELQNLYDSKDKAQQIELLQQQNQLSDQLLRNERQRQLILTLGVVVAALLSVLAFYLYRSAQRSNKALVFANAQLADQSVRDPLTGLLNRRAMQQELQRQAQELADSNDAMVLLDIDHFKRINDRHGHNAGDDVIRTIARRLSEICRDEDKVIRWGGEEFLIYLHNTSKEALPRFVLRMLKTIASDPVQTERAEIGVTATAGFISYPFTDSRQQTIDWEATLQLVDKALYAGKVHGRNQAWGITSLNLPYAEADKVLDTDLARAIDANYVSAVTLHGPE
ncbi:GGDEF domain-containing protein [Pseudidiomarina insulisalsae]|nr:GGDEF domain-containing protein [Pseudidiomarina insulisalsae]